MTRSAVSRALVLVLVSGGLAVLPAGPAQAAPHFQYAPSVQIGYADSATPNVGHDWQQGVNLPLGTQVQNGVTHTSRVYATYEVSQFAGKRIIGGKIRFVETDVADCSKRAIQIWQTKALSATPSWKRRPETLALLGEKLTADYCPAFLTFDVGAAVQEAVRKGKPKVSFELRVPSALEGDPAYYRALNWYNSVSLEIEYNSVPVLHEEHMYHGGLVCSATGPTRKLSYLATYLQALATDADSQDSSNLRFEFAVWRGGNSAPRQIYPATGYFPGRVATVQLPSDQLVDGQTFIWQYRVGDGLDWTAWSRKCRFTVDLTAPPVPAVTSSNYPPAGQGQLTPIGEPGRFTFSANGNTDIIGFEYYFGETSVPGCEWGSGSVGQMVCPEPGSGPGEVLANAPGGTATALINPRSVGENVLRVRSIDAAGNRSFDIAEYEFNSPSQNSPAISVVGAAPEWGQPLTLRFSAGAGVSGTTHFVYTIGAEQPQTVAAGPDGTATITFVADNQYGYQIKTESHSANGFVSPEADWYLTFYPWPTVTAGIYLQGGESYGGTGIADTFTFSRPVGWTQVAAYRYAFNGAEPVDVAADENSRASVTWAPETSGWNSVQVWAVDAEGNASVYSNDYWFSVA